MVAARHNSNPQVVRTLLAFGADVHARDGMGETARMQAAEFNPSRLEVMLEASTDVDMPDDTGLTVWMYVALGRNRKAGSPC